MVKCIKAERIHRHKLVSSVVEDGLRYDRYIDDTIECTGFRVKHLGDKIRIHHIVTSKDELGMIAPYIIYEKKCHDNESGLLNDIKRIYLESEI